MRQTHVQLLGRTCVMKQCPQQRSKHNGPETPQEQLFTQSARDFRRKSGIRTEPDSNHADDECYGDRYESKTQNDPH